MYLTNFLLTDSKLKFRFKFRAQAIPNLFAEYTHPFGCKHLIFFHSFRTISIQAIYINNFHTSSRVARLRVVSKLSTFLIHPAVLIYCASY